MTSMMTMMLAPARATARMSASGRLSRRICGSSLLDSWRRGDIGGQVSDNNVDFFDVQPGQLPDPVADVAADLLGDVENRCGPADADLQGHESLGTIDVHGCLRQRLQIGAAHAEMSRARDRVTQHASRRSSGVGVFGRSPGGDLRHDSVRDAERSQLVTAGPGCRFDVCPGAHRLRPRVSHPCTSRSPSRTFAMPYPIAPSRATISMSPKLPNTSARPRIRPVTVARA